MSPPSHLTKKGTRRAWKKGREWAKLEQNGAEKWAKKRRKRGQTRAKSGGVLIGRVIVVFSDVFWMYVSGCSCFVAPQLERGSVYAFLPESKR